LTDAVDTRADTPQSTAILTDAVDTHADTPRARASHSSASHVARDATLVTTAFDSATGRMRPYYVFAMFGSLAMMLLSFRLGGDPLVLRIFRTSMVVLSASMTTCLLLAWRSRDHGPVIYVLWGTGGLAGTSSIMYFGPFSSIVVVYILTIVVASIGKRRIGLFILVLSAISYLLVVVPIIAGWVPDRGIYSNVQLGTEARVIAAVGLLGMLVRTFWLGRSIRNTGVEALAKLELAERKIGDQKQVLAEIQHDAAQANRWNEGRWTGRRLGAWEIGLVLGRGGMAEVYEAVDSTGRRGAIKVLSAPSDGSRDLHLRFHRELEVIARLQSPHIVRVYEVSPQDAAVPYLVMERLQGFDLASHLRRQTRLSLDDVLAMLRQVASGLETARLEGIVHRDIKPHNLFRHEGSWKILDFGVAKLMGGEGTLTGNALVGTPSYMAPEQASDATGASVTHLADVYALGTVTYRCLTGRAPFGNPNANGTDLASVLYNVVHVAPERPSSFVEIASPVEDALAIAMAKDPKQRFQSATEYAEQLANAARGEFTMQVPRNAWR
jgi:hypothetical protein